MALSGNRKYRTADLDKRKSSCTRVAHDAPSGTLDVTEGDFFSDLSGAYKKYFDFFQSGPIPYIIMEQNGYIREANDAALQLLCDQGDRLSGSFFSLFIPRTCRRAFHEHLHQAFESRTPHTLELSLSSERFPEGRHFLLVSRAVKPPGFTRPICRTQIIDNTLLQRRAKTAENDRILAWSIIYTIREPIVILDRDLRVVFANPVFHSFFQSLPHQIEGASFFGILEGKWNLPVLRDLLLRVLAEHRRFDDFELEAVFPASGRKNLMISGCRMDREGGRRPQILLTMHDLTSKKKQAILEERTRELDSFNYSVSHDLRTPLQIIESFTYLLQDEEYRRKLGSEGNYLIQTIRDSGRKMADIVRGLLDLSRLERIDLTCTAVDMAALARETFGELAMLHPGRTISLLIDDARFPPGFGDPALLRQVLANIIGNAIKFTRIRPRAELELGSRTGDGETVYYVKDNGVGFNQGEAGKLFEVFHRLPSHADFEGTGIGLAIVKRIIERHGGRVFAEAETDKGACFFFSLPHGTGLLTAE